MERGEKAPTIVVLDRIADGLGVPLAQSVASADANRVIVRREPSWRRSMSQAGGSAWSSRLSSPA
jgi:transcriptional regulator with XRE-family HTH domain